MFNLATIVKGIFDASRSVRRVEVRKVYYLSRHFVVMRSFGEIRDMLLLSHVSNFISEEEFLVIYEEYQPADLTFSTLFVWGVSL